MNKNWNSYSFIPFYSYFMDYAPVKEIVDREGADGLGAVTALLLQLLKFRGGIASLSDLKTLAVPLRKRKAYLLHIVTDYRMFRVTPDGLSFYSPYLRKVMKLVLEIETANDYYHSTNNRQTGQDNAPSTASKRVGKSFANDLQMNSKSFANEFAKNENADNQAVSEPNDDNMYNKDNKNNKNNIYIKNNSSSTSNKKNSGEFFSEEDEKSFLKKNNPNEVTPAPDNPRRRKGLRSGAAALSLERKGSAGACRQPRECGASMCRAVAFSSIHIAAPRLPRTIPIRYQ